jgi:hypothetical protein
MIAGTDKLFIRVAGDWQPEKHFAIHDIHAQSTYFLSSAIEYDRYLHFVFVAWTLSMLLFSLMVFGWRNGVPLRFGVDVRFSGINVLLARKFLFLPQIIVKNCVEVPKVGYQFSYKLLDKGVFEIVFAYGIVSVTSDVLRKSKLLHRGSIYHHGGILWPSILLSSMFVLALW